MEAKINKEENEPQLSGEAKMALTDIFDLNADSADTLILEERVNLLNDDQRRIFDKVKSHLLHQEMHENKNCQCDFKPLRMFVSGIGGTGKPFLIEAIKLLVSDIWPSRHSMCYCSSYRFSCFQCGWYYHSQILSAAY